MAYMNGIHSDRKGENVFFYQNHFNVYVPSDATNTVFSHFNVIQQPVNRVQIDVAEQNISGLSRD